MKWILILLKWQFAGAPIEEKDQITLRFWNDRVSIQLLRWGIAQ